MQERFKLQDTAAKAIDSHAHLGERITLVATEQRLFGVRIAGGTVCRENIDRVNLLLEVRLAQAGKEAAINLEANALDLSACQGHIEQLAKDLSAQPIDQEYVAAAVPEGEFHYMPEVSSFEQAYAQGRLYSKVQELDQRARAVGLRLTGYIEAQQSHHHILSEAHKRKSSITSQDHGATISLTIDDPKTGAVSAANRGVALANAESLGMAIESVFSEALARCLKTKEPGKIDAGDYQVILHPQAVTELINTSLGYGFFDRRKIDEGRTYLSANKDQLRFAKGLSFRQTTKVPLADASEYRDMPLNHRLVPCTDLDLIKQGRITDLHTSAYWGQTKGLPETFDANRHAPASVLSYAGPGLAPDLDALIKNTKHGLFVTNLWYLRMVTEMDGILTGMTRDGVFEIIDGEITRPVLNLRWHDNPLRLLARINGAVQHPQVFGRSRLAGGGRTRLTVAPALRIADMHFSSVSRF